MLNPGVLFISMAMQQCGGSTGQQEGTEMSAEKVSLDSPSLTLHVKGRTW